MAALRNDLTPAALPAERVDIVPEAKRQVTA